jgi:transposase-like protein
MFQTLSIETPMPFARPRSYKDAPPNAKAIIDARRSGASRAEVSRRFGISPEAVSTTLARYRVKLKPKVPGKKRCWSCKQFCGLDQFHKNKASHDGVSNTCKPCAKARVQEWANKNRVHIRKKQMDWRGKRKESGLCGNCNSQVMPGSRVRQCEKHWYGTVACGRLGDSLLWPQLREMAERQQFRCVYTGETLVPGVNMSLDHIMPTSRFPHLAGEITNVQWVTKKINVMKGARTHDEFVALCRLIANTFG